MASAEVTQLTHMGGDGSARVRYRPVTVAARTKQTHATVSVGAAATAGGAWVLAAGDVRAWERALARRIYDLPRWTTGPLEVVMQAGNRLAIVVVGGVLLLLGRRRAAAGVALGGLLGWAAAVAGKALVARSRPDATTLGRPLRAVVDGHGFPSSHAAVAAGIVVALVLVLPLRSIPTVLLMLVVLATAIARVHLGVHWPLDVAGGAAVGSLGGATGAWMAGRWVR